MGIPGCRLHLGMSEQFANDRQAHAVADCDAGECVPDVMDPSIFQAGAGSDPLPEWL